MSSTEENGLPTCEHWHARGGIVGRGVLVDYKAYAEETGQTGAVPYSPFDGHRITVQELEAVAKHQGVEFRPGDILIVRTGYTELLEGPTEALVPQFSKGTLSGVHGTEETARWVWNHRFAAVAGDSHAFEAIPPVKPDGSVAGMADLGKCNSKPPKVGSGMAEHDFPDSASPMVSKHVRAPHRGALGSQGLVGALQEVWAVQLHAELGASESPRPRGFSAKRPGHFLRKRCRNGRAEKYFAQNRNSTCSLVEWGPNLITRVRIRLRRKLL